MAVAVDADLVPGGGDLGRERRPALDLLADEVEGRPHAGARRAASSTAGVPSRMRAVVEGQREPAAARQAQRDPEGRRERRARRARRRARTRRRARGSETDAALRRMQPRAAPSASARTNEAADGSSGKSTAVRPCSSAAATASRSAAGRRRDLRRARSA